MMAAVDDACYFGNDVDMLTLMNDDIVIDVSSSSDAAEVA